MVSSTDRSASALVTVVICVYNAGDFLRPAVESILKQTYPNLEVLIINNCTDGCLSTVQDLATLAHRILHQENRGKPAAMNYALSELKGEFYACPDTRTTGFRSGSSASCSACETIRRSRRYIVVTSSSCMAATSPQRSRPRTARAAERISTRCACRRTTRLGCTASRWFVTSATMRSFGSVRATTTYCEIGSSMP